MKLSSKQRDMHFALFGQICERQGWAALSAKEKKLKRVALYRELELPDSFSEFNKQHFDTFIEETAPLRDDIDIRDRSRETVIHTITRLDLGIAELTGRAGGEYTRRILLDWHDTNDVEKLATIQPADLESRGHRDLANLSMTLKNRLSKMITAVKKGEIDRDDLLVKWRKKGEALPDATGLTYRHISNNDIIDQLIAGKALCEVEAPEPQPDEPAPIARTRGRSYTVSEKKAKFQPRPQLQPVTTLEDDSIPF